MKCSACQAEIKDFSTVCPKCGGDPNANPYQAPAVAKSAPSTETDATGGMIPYKNPKALIAYYLGIFSFIPLLGLFLAVPAFVLGILGLRDRNRNPAIKGSVHAGIGIGCGGFFILVWGISIVMIIIGIITDGRR